MVRDRPEDGRKKVRVRGVANVRRELEYPLNGGRINKDAVGTNRDVGHTKAERAAQQLVVDTAEKNHGTLASGRRPAGQVSNRQAIKPPSPGPTVLRPARVWNVFIVQTDVLKYRFG